MKIGLNECHCRAPTREDWDRLARRWKPWLDERIAALERLEECGILTLPAPRGTAAEPPPRPIVHVRASDPQPETACGLAALESPWPWRRRRRRRTPPCGKRSWTAVIISAVRGPSARTSAGSSATGAGGRWPFCCSRRRRGSCRRGTNGSAGARLTAAAACTLRCRTAVCGRPPERNREFQKHRKPAVGRCRMSGLSDAALSAAGPHGVRGPDPNRFRGLEALRLFLVLPAPSFRLLPLRCPSLPAHSPGAAGSRPGGRGGRPEFSPSSVSSFSPGSRQDAAPAR